MNENLIMTKTSKYSIKKTYADFKYLFWSIENRRFSTPWISSVRM